MVPGGCANRCTTSPLVANGIGRSIVALTTANIAALAPSTSVSVAAQVKKYALRCSSERQACRSSFANVVMARL